MTERSWRPRMRAVVNRISAVRSTPQLRTGTSTLGSAATDQRSLAVYAFESTGREHRGRMVAPTNKLEIVQRFYRAALKEDEEERLRSNRNSRSRRRFRRAVAQRAASERLWREILAHGDHAALAACTYDVEQLLGIDLGELAYDGEFLQLLGRAFVEIARTKRARDRGDFFGEAADPLFRAPFVDATLMKQSATEEVRCPSADTPEPRSGSPSAPTAPAGSSAITTASAGKSSWPRPGRRIVLRLSDSLLSGSPPPRPTRPHRRRPRSPTC